MIHLVRPPYKTDSVCPPINLLALASYVEPHHPVSLTDFVVPYVRGEMSLDAAGLRRAATQILENPAPVLGFTAMCSSFAAAVRIAEQCKIQDSSRTILFGGPHVSFVAAESLRAFDCIDAVVIGEGEEALRDVLDAIHDGRPLKGIQNLMVRDGDATAQTPRRPVVDDLDALPVPAFHLIKDIDAYYTKGVDRFIEIEAGRGCPFDCNFCSTSLFFSRKYRVKSPERLLSEMRWLRDNWKIQAFGLIHDNLTSSKEKVRQFCQFILDANETFSWFCSSRTDTIDRPLMDIMREAGCRGVFFGVETGSQDMQRIMGKRLKVRRVRDTFEQLLEADLSGTASFIIGFPEERLEALEDTLSMALLLRVVGVRDVQLHPLSALPGTHILTQYEDRLVFHPYLLTFHDITSVIEITDVEKEWIEKHRRIFSNFYAVRPLHYPLELVYQVRGCYFYLIHFRPFTLSALCALGKLKHVDIVRLLTEKLSANFEDWAPPELLRALSAVIEDLPGEEKRFFVDLDAYERAMVAAADFTSGDNGWIRYKGPVPSVSSTAGAGPTLKPCQALPLEYDVLAAVRALKEGRDEEPIQRSLHMAIVFDWDGQRVRTLEVDALTSRIIQESGQGDSLEDILGRLSQENPYLETEADRHRWIEQVLVHLAKAKLLVEPVGLDQPADPVAEEPLQNAAPV